MQNTLFDFHFDTTTSVTVATEIRNPVLEQHAQRMIKLNPGDPASFADVTEAKREIVPLMRREKAQDFLAGLRPGFHRFGFSKGQFSLIDLLRAFIEVLPPIEDMAISTWTVAAADLGELQVLMTPEKIPGRVRWLIDLSFQRRQPTLIQQIRKVYGYDAIRITRNHAKFILIRAGNYRLVTRTSMNLNFNPRLEDIDVCDSPELFAYISDVMDEFFEKHEPKKQIGRKVRELSSDFTSH
jgi:hypothetical protein